MFFMTNFFNKRNQAKEKARLPDLPAELHQTLGMRLEEGYLLVNKLYEAWNDTSAAAVKNRLIGKGILSNKEYGWYELELKRFFCLSAIMKNVPMYNEKVDAIWHDMILFTKDYADFCEQFNGAMIHHTPTDKASMTKASASHERAVYELVYGILFDPHSGSELIQRPFGRCLLGRQFMLECKQLKGQELERYIQDTIFKNENSRYDHLIHKISKQIAHHVTEAKERIERSGTADTRNVKRSLSSSDQAVYLPLYTSMEAAHEPEEKERDSAAISSCNGSDGRRYDHDRSDTDHHGSDSSGGSADSGDSSSSSCSSCGGGCSS
ncbi:hypothetical protein [Domibacillus iocasae]|uniref:Uncharacterized protein n=1 Tax=Domibacillus iocasae TaxID=1714016 RepID=A0A1E7DLF4_9BACI|nr:hypothetical protein [Domibacillus iocasae]OES43883.1 hypothetical protein BA724_12390 [Domibacillus iocasae]